MDAYGLMPFSFYCLFFFPPSFFVLVFHGNEARLTRLCCLRARSVFFRTTPDPPVSFFQEAFFFSPAIHPPRRLSVHYRTHTHTHRALLGGLCAHEPCWP